MAEYVARRIPVEGVEDGFGRSPCPRERDQDLVELVLVGGPRRDPDEVPPGSGRQGDVGERFGHACGVGRCTRQNRRAVGVENLHAEVICDEGVAEGPRRALPALCHGVVCLAAFVVGLADGSQRDGHHGRGRRDREAVVVEVAGPVAAHVLDELGLAGAHGPEVGGRRGCVILLEMVAVETLHAANVVVLRAVEVRGDDRLEQLGLVDGADVAEAHAMPVFVRQHVPEVQGVAGQVAVEQRVARVEDHVTVVGVLVVGQRVEPGLAVDQVPADADVAAHAELAELAEERHAVVVRLVHVGDAADLGPAVEDRVDMRLPRGRAAVEAVEEREEAAHVRGLARKLRRDGRAVRDEAVGERDRRAIAEESRAVSRRGGPVGPRLIPARQGPGATGQGLLQRCRHLWTHGAGEAGRDRYLATLLGHKLFREQPFRRREPSERIR